jgi:hypothetical protein
MHDRLVANGNLGYVAHSASLVDDELLDMILTIRIHGGVNLALLLVDLVCAAPRESRESEFWSCISERRLDNLRVASRLTLVCEACRRFNPSRWCRGFAKVAPQWGIRLANAVSSISMDTLRSTAAGSHSYLICAA